MKKETWKGIRQAFAILALVAILIGTTFEITTKVSAQNTGNRAGPNGPVFVGQNSGPCFESAFLVGVDTCISRVASGSLTINDGGINQGNAFLAPAPVVALATATTGGFIVTGTSYRLALTYVTPNGGETNITSTQEATQTTTGAGNTSTITATAPIAAAGAAGYRVYSTNASGVGNSNTTLTELSQPITTAVCAGAFQVNGPAGPGTGIWVCPFGTNAVLTTITTTAATATVPNIPGSGPTTLNGGVGIPGANTASYAPGIPQLICTMLPQTALATITTIQVMGTCPLGTSIQNAIGKVVHVKGYGVYTSGAQTGTMTISLIEGGITPCTVTSNAITTGGQTNAQFNFECYLTTLTTGSAGTLVAAMTQAINTATANNLAAMTLQQDNIHGAASSAINLTTANTLTVNLTMSASTTSAVLNSAFVYLEN